MNVRSLHWLGIRTDKFEATVRFFRDVMGLPVASEEPDFAEMRLPDGSRVEVFGPADTEHRHFTTGPVVGFQVDDIQQTRVELEAAGIEFFGPIRSLDGGYSWSHFRGPDGNVYEITYSASEP
jgi:catechol 2,3-dioxygenase-like lactoylglutathione lyase family enzyme